MPLGEHVYVPTLEEFLKALCKEKKKKKKVEISSSVPQKEIEMSM